MSSNNINLRLCRYYKRIPAGSIDRYESLCRELLTGKEYKKWLWEVRHNGTFLENIFSVRNERSSGIKYKVINILGIKIRIKPKKKQEAA